MKKNFAIILLLVVLLGAFLRFYKLESNSFVADEFLDINSSYAYFKTGEWQSWDFNRGKVNTGNTLEARDERAWIYKWQVAQLFKVFPPTEGVARSISAVWGIITIFLMYWTGWYFTKRKTVGLLSAFLFAVSIAGIEFDRKLRMYAMFFPVFLIFSLMLFRFFEEPYKGKIKLCKFISDNAGINILFIIPVAITGVASMLVHQLTVNIIAIFFAYCAAQFFWCVKNKKPLWNKYLVSSALLLVGFFAVFFIAPEKLKSYSAGLQFFNNHFIYFQKVFSDYSHLLVALILLLIGGHYFIKQKEITKGILWLSVSFFVPLFMAMFLWSRNVGDQYIFFIRSFEIILIACGIYAVAKFFENSLVNYGKKAYLSTIILAVILLPNYGYFFGKNNTYSQTSESENPNYRKIFGYVKKYREPKDVIITRNFRNYYFSGENLPVYDFGGELTKEKLSLADVQKISSENASGWFVISDNDDCYISNDAMEFIEKNFERVSNVAVRGKVKVYRWKNI